MELDFKYFTDNEDTNDWFPEKRYEGSWLSSIDVWQDMLSKEDNGRSKFANLMIQYYEKAVKAASQFKGMK